MKKLLFQFDTDQNPSSFDVVVAYDGGADQVVSYGQINSVNVASLVEGTIFTRPPKAKKNTAIFVGGSNLANGEALFKTVQQQFFSNFRVSIMLDSNGSNTTSAAAVAKIASCTEIADKKAVILGGTGPVGQRAALLLAMEGADVSITSRRLSSAEAICAALKQQFDLEITPVEASDYEARAEAINDAQIVLATGAGGIELLKPEHWQNNPNLQVIVDANATPPLGIGGLDIMCKGETINKIYGWGALGFGPLKLKVHRACIEKMFVSNSEVFDALNIFALAKQL